MTNKKVIQISIVLIFLALVILGIWQTQRIPRPSLESTTTFSPRDFSQARLAMVERAIKEFNLHNQDVIHSMRNVPRHLFVPEDLRHVAYDDFPLPIGYGQTISAPYMVAWMTELMDLKPGERILEIGTGSGYQAAVLAELGYVKVYSIEIIPELAQQAKARLFNLGYQKINLREGDGYFGWLEEAPFDAILVTAAPDHLPQPLVQQLSENGRLLIPIGPVGGYQTLWKFTKQHGELLAENMGGVIFVPLVSRSTPQPLPTPAE